MKLCEKLKTNIFTRCDCWMIAIVMLCWLYPVPFLLHKFIIGSFQHSGEIIGFIFITVLLILPVFYINYSVYIIPVFVLASIMNIPLELLVGGSSFSDFYYIYLFFWIFLSVTILKRYFRGKWQ